jgi:hypothetical protein
MSQPAADKIIVTNVDQLTHKYQSSGSAAIGKAVKNLIKADAARGIVTQFVDVSDPKTMAYFGATPIPAASAGDAKLNKNAIDKIYTKAQPSYLMLLGSVDVIPHVPLDNPTPDDHDPNMPSDLPYACDKPYSTDVQDFIAPTRVVGRLPNVTGDTGPTYLSGLLHTAASYKDRLASDYNGFLGISADVWKKSTSLSLDAVFGTHSAMKISPPDGPKWTAAEAKRLAHFINCHGAAGTPNFYGQKGNNFPEAHTAVWMAGKVVEATVLAAECCFGAELYDPAHATVAGQPGMCNTYLGRKAYAYFGSSTTAYGPDTSNDQADLLCQDFLLNVLDGASAGRACLQARLQYVSKKGGVLAPTDLKTIGQFNLMGDPSLTPVRSAPHLAPIPVSGGAKATAAATFALARHERIARRAMLVSRAEVSMAHRLHKPARVSAGIKTGVLGKLLKLAAEQGMRDPDAVVSYAIGELVAPEGGKAVTAASTLTSHRPKRIHAILKRLSPPKDVPHLRLVRGLEGIEYDDGMVVRAFVSR